MRRTSSAVTAMRGFYASATTCNRTYVRLPCRTPMPVRGHERSFLTAAYAELHCHSAYSFLDGASRPEELVARAHELGHSALALTDHDNLCGALEFAHAARE